MTRVLGAILAGGAARRFGADKALALWRGTALIDHVAAALAPQVDALLVCGRAHAGLANVADRPGPGLGPLAGLAAALHHAARHGFDRVVSVPCDTPRLPFDLVVRLGDGPSYASALPVIGCWPATLAPALDRHLAADGSRSLRGWSAAIGAIGVDLGPIPNINAPADLAALGSLPS